MVVVPELAGDVQLVTGEAGGRDRLTDTVLVAVGLRGVDVAVARLERLAHDLAGRRGVGLRALTVGLHVEGAEPKLGDRGAVVEVDRGEGGGARAHRGLSVRGAAVRSARPSWAPGAIDPNTVFTASIDFCYAAPVRFAACPPVPVLGRRVLQRLDRALRERVSLSGGRSANTSRRGRTPSIEQRAMSEYACASRLGTQPTARPRAIARA